MTAPRPSVFQRCFAELAGTFLLVFFGCGSVHAAVLMGAQQGVWQVAIVWGVAIAIAIYVVGPVSGAHINPAMTLAFTVWGKSSPGQMVPYMASQMIGAMSAAALLFYLFQPFYEKVERSLGVDRGSAGSEMTAMCLCEYYPNPAGLRAGWDKNDPSRLSDRQSFFETYPIRIAMVAEFLGTAILAIAVFALIDPTNKVSPTSNLAPIFIGLTVSILISVLAPLTQACFNPARDFGPRLFAFYAGWGEIALPGPNGDGWWTVYIVAPLAGAVVGGGLYEKVLKAPEAF